MSRHKQTNEERRLARRLSALFPHDTSCETQIDPLTSGFPCDCGALTFKRIARMLMEARA